MFYSTQLTQDNVFSHFSTAKKNKSSIFRSPTIHSSTTRNSLYYDGTSFGKLRNSVLKRDNSTGLPSAEKVAQVLNAQNWRKNLSVNVKEEDIERGLRDYLGISQPFRPKTSDLKENTAPYNPLRTGTSSSNRRGPLAISSVKSVKSGKSFIRLPVTSDFDGMLRRDLMCQTEEVDVDGFVDDKTQEKFCSVKFVKAPSKEFLKLLKLSNYEVTLVPSDSRRVVLEAMLRDYFLNLIPENSDFLICKNSQSKIYTIVFTGRLVPICKGCSSVTRFEISKDLGFQVICSSPYCNIKVLYRSQLSEKTRECLWPVGIRPDMEHSLPIKASRAPQISKIIQSGKYKVTDFSRIVSDTQVTSQPEANKRPNTTANIMRNVGSASRVNRIVIKTSFNDKSLPFETNQRPNTVQGLRRLTGLSGLRPGTAGSGGSMDIKDFKGMSILKEFDDEGLFAREKEEIGVIEHVSEEMSGDEDEIQESGKKGRVMGRDEGYEVKRPVGKRNVVGSQESSKLDNSMEDIHNMVNILSKEK